VVDETLGKIANAALETSKHATVKSGESFVALPVQNVTEFSLLVHLMNWSCFICKPLTAS
jgi:hypothetical protein